MRGRRECVDPCRLIRTNDGIRLEERIEETVRNLRPNASDLEVGKTVMYVKVVIWPRLC